MPSSATTTGGSQRDAMHQVHEVYSKYLGHISMPILEWAPKYKWSQFTGDVTASIVVFILLIPQGMAYAVLAGVPPIYGLYCATLPLIVYGFFGTSREMSIAAFSIISLLAAESLAKVGYVAETDEYIKAASSLALLSGIISVLMGMLKLGLVVSFMSSIVIEGFVVASAIIIIITQLKSMLGFSVPSFDYSLQTLYYVIVHLDETNWATLVISVVSFSLLYWAKAWKQQNKKPSKEQLAADKYFNVKQVCANYSGLLVMCLCMLIAYLFIENGIEVDIIGDVPAGMQAPSIPTVGNFTELLPGAVVVSIMTFLSNWSICVKFAMMHGYDVNASQELVASGAANIVGSLFGAFPVAGGLARSAANNEAGAKTAMSSIFAGCLIIIALFVLTPLFFYIPKAVLGTIIVISIVSMLDTAQFVHSYRVNKKDFVIICITFLVTLGFGITFGLCAGILTSLLAVLYTNSFPVISTLGVAKNDRYEAFMSSPAGSASPESVAIATLMVKGNAITSDNDGDSAAGECRTHNLFDLILSDRARFISDTTESSHIPGVVLLRMDAALFFANSLLFKTAIEEAAAGEHLSHQNPYTYCQHHEDQSGLASDGDTPGTEGAYSNLAQSEDVDAISGHNGNTGSGCAPLLSQAVPTKLVIIDVGGWNDVDVVGTTLLKEAMKELAVPKKPKGKPSEAKMHYFGSLVAFVNCDKGTVVHQRLTAAKIAEETIKPEEDAAVPPPADGMLSPAPPSPVPGDSLVGLPKPTPSPQPTSGANAPPAVVAEVASVKVPIVYESVAEALSAFPRRWASYRADVCRKQLQQWKKDEEKASKSAPKKVETASSDSTSASESNSNGNVNGSGPVVPRDVELVNNV